MVSPLCVWSSCCSGSDGGPGGIEDGNDEVMVHVVFAPASAGKAKQISEVSV